jgi:predicted secreted Zn-dependent protease
MTRLIGSLAIALALAALPTVTQAQGGAKAPEKAITVAGQVSAVTMDSLTVKGPKTDTWTFTIDKATQVIAKGATHKTLELKAEGKANKLTEFVKVGDQVTVSYHDRGATKHAGTIRVTAAAK